MRKSLCISLVLLFTCVSCSLKMTRDLSPVVSKVTSVENPYFTSDKAEYVYKMAIDAYGKSVGGVLVIKKLGLEHYRLALMTEFGSTLLDMELFDGDFTMHKVSDELNKKVILKTLKSDFNLLLKQRYKPTKVFEQDEGLLYQASSKKGFTFLRFDSFGELFEIVQSGKVKEKVFITFLETTGKEANRILIDHANRKLSIVLKKIVKSN
ncbi:hypothetical protein MWU59_05575 [Flavobacteriaceae bacterium F08102]|nr:hypothetical protein [Flavobacteriaceae bacterium F08102]